MALGGIRCFRFHGVKAATMYLNDASTLQPEGGLGDPPTIVRVRNTRSNAPRSRPKSGRFLKEAFGGTSTCPVRDCDRVQM